MERGNNTDTMTSINVMSDLQKRRYKNCINYREISLLNTSYKVLSKIILYKLKPYTKEIVGEY